MPDRQLLIIDAQNDFCALPTYSYSPALAVKGAHDDCLRLARLIQQGGLAISGIIATLDSHQPLDLANAVCWRDRYGGSVPTFTAITAAEVRNGDYRPIIGVSAQDGGQFLRAYFDALEQAGRTLTLWPEHCQIGTPGHNLHPEIASALRQWSLQRLKPITFIQKGENIWTESFSALKAVFPYPDDESTQLNQGLLALLARQTEILVAGQASSHCVKETVEDLLRYAPALRDKLVLLTDCMSPVPGFENIAQQFFADMQAHGVRLASSADLLAELTD
jgi:nicotinamidase-related amidase